MRFHVKSITKGNFTYTYRTLIEREKEKTKNELSNIFNKNIKISLKNNNFKNMRNTTNNNKNDSIRYITNIDYKGNNRYNNSKIKTVNDSAFRPNRKINVSPLHNKNKKLKFFHGLTNYIPFNQKVEPINFINTCTQSYNKYNKTISIYHSKQNSLKSSLDLAKSYKIREKINLNSPNISYNNSLISTHNNIEKNNSIIIKEYNNNKEFIFKKNSQLKYSNKK